MRLIHFISYASMNLSNHPSINPSSVMLLSDHRNHLRPTRDGGQSGELERGGGGG